jgi:hypothetical protein
VDVGVAGGAEHGGVSLARDGGGRELADLAHPHALVGEPRVARARVARRAEERATRGARAAVHRRGRRLAAAAPPASDAPVLVQLHQLVPKMLAGRGGRPPGAAAQLEAEHGAAMAGCVDAVLVEEREGKSARGMVVVGALHVVVGGGR